MESISTVAESKLKSINPAGILILGILLISPLFFLQNLLDELARKDTSYLEILARERLINSMEKFQDALKPTKYIDTAIADMNAKFGLRDQHEKQRDLTCQPGEDPHLIKNDFIDNARTFLEQHYRLRPFLMVAADCDLQHSYFWNSPEIFSDDLSKNAFVKSLTLLHGAFGMQNHLKTSENPGDRIQKFLNQFSASQTCPISLYEIISKYFWKHISCFSNLQSKLGCCSTFFMNRFGNQRAYQTTIRFTSRFTDYETFLGMYFACFSGSDISPLTMLKKALNEISPENGRHILRHQPKQPGFHKRGEKLLYYAKFPTPFYAVVEDSGIKEPQTRLKLMKFLQQHCLVTSVDTASTVSVYTRANKITGAAIKLSLLLLAGVFVRMLMGFSTSRLRLGAKLRVAVTLIVLMPVIGVFLVSELIKSGEKKLAVERCQTQIRQRLKVFERLVNDYESMVMIKFQELKKNWADSLFGAPDSYLPVVLPESHSPIPMILSENGDFFESASQKIQAKPTRDSSGLFRILADLAAINLNSSKARELQKKQLFMNSVLDNYWGVFATGNILARESMIIKSFMELSLVKKGCYHLLASPATPQKPEAIVFSKVEDTINFTKFFRNIISETPHLFSDYNEHHTVDYGLFARNSSVILNSQVPFSGPGIRQLLAIANMAVEKKSSGSFVNIENGKGFISSWIYLETLPVIIVAKGIVAIDQEKQIHYFILPLLLLIYALLAVILLSDFLAEALLDPVQTLVAFVKSIHRNIIDVRAEIKSGDEFSELAGSFNQMSKGLCQREKLRRFVSEKLFASLETSPGADRHHGKIMVTILSSDIRGFTTISEQNEPEEVVSLLNTYFSLMETAIIANGGSIEKIIGDAVVAAFYEENGNHDHAKKACTAALHMKKLLAEFNQQRSEQQKFSIETGIGIATGEAVLGFAGSNSRRREFVLLGDVVRNAETLESMTKDGVSSKIFVDEATVAFIKNQIVLCPPEDQPGAIFYRELKND